MKEKRAEWHVYYWNNLKNNWTQYYEFFLFPTIAFTKDHSFDGYCFDIIFEWLFFKFIISRYWDE